VVQDTGELPRPVRKSQGGGARNAQAVVNSPVVSSMDFTKLVAALLVICALITQIQRAAVVLNQWWRWFGSSLQRRYDAHLMRAIERIRRRKNGADD